MALFPILVFIISVVSIFSFLSISEVYYVLYKLFPSIADKVLDLIMNTAHSKILAGSLLINIILSFYFSKDLFIALSYSFWFIFESKEMESKKVLLISIFSLPFLVFAIILIYILKLIINFLIFNVEKFHSFEIKSLDSIIYFINSIIQKLDLIFEILNISEYFIICFFVWLIYYNFTPLKNKKLIKEKVFFISIFVALVIFVLKIAFTNFIKNFFIINPLYLIFGSLFFIIIWIKICFDILLIGERFLFYLVKKQG